LALSTAISAIVQIIILTIILQKRLRIKIGREVLVSILKTVTASLAMVIACWFVLKMFPVSDGSGTLYFKGLRLFAPMTAALAAFAVASIVLKSEEFGHLVRLSLRKS
jgi:putative peptidoglycan lipid II flippase